jgi:hypothetical protein
MVDMGREMVALSNKSDALKKHNDSLTKDNKKFRKKNGILVEKEKHLRKKNAQLIEKNRNLVNKFAEVKRKVVSWNKSDITRKMHRAERKLASAPARMLPIAGTAVVVGLTAYEINELCEDVKKINKFESGLFKEDSDDVHVGQHESDSICGLDIESKLIPIAEEQARNTMESIARFAEEQSGDARDILRGWYEQSTDTVYGFSEDLWNEVKKFEFTIPYFSE